MKNEHFKTVFVRPGRTLSLISQAHVSGWCVGVTATLRVSPDAIVGSERPTARYSNTGAWYARPVTLHAGATATTVEHIRYGRDERRTMIQYVADHASWRVQRSEHLTQLFSDQRARHEANERAALVRAKRAEALRVARIVADRLATEAATTALGRSGGRARRRANRLRAEAREAASVVATLASGQFLFPSHIASLGARLVQL